MRNDYKKLIIYTITFQNHYLTNYIIYFTKKKYFLNNYLNHILFIHINLNSIHR